MSEDLRTTDPQSGHASNYVKQVDILIADVQMKANVGPKNSRSTKLVSI